MEPTTIIPISNPGRRRVTKTALLDYLHQYAPLGEPLRRWLTDCISERHLLRQEQLLRPGEVCRAICFIVQGMLRSYTLSADGRDTTGWFMKECDIAIAVRSFYRQVPATEYIEALEPTTLLYISYDQLQATYTRFPEMNLVGRHLTEKYYMLAEERLEGMRNRCAADRYAFLLERHPEIFERATLGHIASYLDLNRDTLGRLRRQMTPVKKQ